MIVCGCDVGSLTVKAVIMEDDQILSWEIVRTDTRPDKVAEHVIGKALEKAKCSKGDLAMVMGTGYGREQIEFADDVLSEIACHGKGAKWLIPSVKMVIDIGGQDTKAIKVNKNGEIQKYVYNDACATGTGRFLEVMAEALGVELENMGELSLEAKETVNISNQCAVFAETEVISLVNQGYHLNDILGGLHHALAQRVVALARSIVLEEDITFTGGVAKNIGVFKSIEDTLGVKLKKMDKIDPQINGAVGAALFAQESQLKS